MKCEKRSRSLAWLLGEPKVGALGFGMLPCDNRLSKAEKGEFKPLGEGLTVFPKGFSFFSVYMSLKRKLFRASMGSFQKKVLVYIFLGLYKGLAAAFHGNSCPSLLHVLDRVGWRIGRAGSLRMDWWGEVLQKAWWKASGSMALTWERGRWPVGTWGWLGMEEGRRVRNDQTWKWGTGCLKNWHKVGWARSRPMVLWFWFWAFGFLLMGL